MVVDHIGIVVRSLQEGIQQWEELFGYRKTTDIVLNTRQKVKVVFLTKTDSVMIKLLEPSDASSPMFAFARRGGGLHHICFRCLDLATEIPVLNKKGAKLIVPPQPGEAFNNHEIAFFMAKNNLNLELIDTAEKIGAAAA